MKTILEGFMFGMMLQVAVGPVALYVARTAANEGIWMALAAVAAATIVDAVFMILSLLGVSALLIVPKVRRAVRMISGFVLLAYGLYIIATTLSHWGQEPQAAQLAMNSFLATLLLTASNPLTILFWSGIFSQKILKQQWQKRRIFVFSIGCLSATIIALGGLAGFTAAISLIIPALVMDLLNIGVGVLISGFGFKMILSRMSRKATISPGV